MFRHRNGRTDARHHMPRDSCFLEGQGLFPTPSKDETVSSFEPDHPFPFPGLLDQQAVDGFLSHTVMPAAFAHRQQLRIRSGLLEYFRRHQGIVQHRMGPSQDTFAFQGQESLAAAGTYQPDFPS